MDATGVLLAVWTPRGLQDSTEGTTHGTPSRAVAGTNHGCLVATTTIAFHIRTSPCVEPTEVVRQGHDMLEAQNWGKRSQTSETLRASSALSCAQRRRSAQHPCRGCFRGRSTSHAQSRSFAYLQFSNGDPAASYSSRAASGSCGLPIRLRLAYYNCAESSGDSALTPWKRGALQNSSAEG